MVVSLEEDFRMARSSIFFPKQAERGFATSRLCTTDEDDTTIVRI
jgi:hypothetical protein